MLSEVQFNAVVRLVVLRIELDMAKLKGLHTLSLLLPAE